MLSSSNALTATSLIRRLLQPISSAFRFPLSAGKKDDAPAKSSGIREYKMPENYPKEYNHWSTFVEREWWRHHERVHYWATWRQYRDWRTRKQYCDLWPERNAMEAMSSVGNNILPKPFRSMIDEEIAKMPKNSNFWRVRHSCQFTGRTRGRVMRFRISRIVFRRLADHGKICGVQRAKWG